MLLQGVPMQQQNAGGSVPFRDPRGDPFAATGQPTGNMWNMGGGGSGPPRGNPMGGGGGPFGQQGGAPPPQQQGGGQQGGRRRFPPPPSNPTPEQLATWAANIAKTMHPKNTEAARATWRKILEKYDRAKGGGNGGGGPPMPSEPVAQGILSQFGDPRHNNAAPPRQSKRSISRANHAPPPVGSLHAHPITGHGPTPTIEQQLDRGGASTATNHRKSSTAAKRSCLGSIPEDDGDGCGPLGIHHSSGRGVLGTTDTDRMMRSGREDDDDDIQNMRGMTAASEPPRGMHIPRSEGGSEFLQNWSSGGTRSRTAWANAGDYDGFASCTDLRMTSNLRSRGGRMRALLPPPGNPNQPAKAVPKCSSRRSNIPPQGNRVSSVRVTDEDDFAELGY